MINPDRFTDSERTSFYDAIQYLDPDNNYIVTDKKHDFLAYNESRIKCREKISGTPDDRELIRAIISVLIIKRYKWPHHVLEIGPVQSAKQTGDRKNGALQSGIYIKNKNEDIEILCIIRNIYEYRRPGCRNFYRGSLNKAIEECFYHPYETIVPHHIAEKLFYMSLEIPVARNHFPLYCLGFDVKKIKTRKDRNRQVNIVHFFDFPVYKTGIISQYSYIKAPGKSNKNRIDLDSQVSRKKILTVWDHLWDEIWGGTLEDNKKFENFNKVLLAKIYDEQQTYNGTPYVFQIKTRAGIPQTEKELACDIDLLYRRGYMEYLAKDKTGDVSRVQGIDFNEFSPYMISQCVRLLQSLSLCKNRFTDTDILGEFYEKIIRKTFKQTKGLFLTHPNLVLFIIAALDIETIALQQKNQGDEKRFPFIIDPCCGTGTFLILYIQYMRKYMHQCNTLDPVTKDAEKDPDNLPSALTQAESRIEENIYGIDKDAILAQACRLNLILHRNGNTDIYAHIINTDSLDPFYTLSMAADKRFDAPAAGHQGIEFFTGPWKNITATHTTDSTGFYSKPCLNKFDIVISNPPFNTTVHRSEIQDSFTVSGKSELYFLERWYQVLKPGGRLGVVLPESFFAVEDTLAGRLFLYRHFTIKAVVSLPDHAFHPHTNISTSLLFAVKKTGEEEQLFQSKWETCEAFFKQQCNDIISRFPDLLKIEEKAEEYFGTGFMVFPFFEHRAVCNPEQHNAIKKALKNVLEKNRDRWILLTISKESEEKFYNFSVREIGYKAGKKGSKARPNELISLYDENNNKIYDLKYSHTWNRIDKEDPRTVLGRLKALKIWKRNPDKQDTDSTPDTVKTGIYSDNGIICEQNSLTHICGFHPMRCDTHFIHNIRRAEHFFSNNRIEWVTLGSVLENVQNGINVATSYYSMKKTGIHYLSVTQVKESGLSRRNQIYLAEEIRELDYFYKLEENMVIITRSGTIGIALSTNHPAFCFHNTTYVPSGFLITAKIKPGYSADVIAHYINLPDVKNYMNAMASGVCQKNISQPVIRNLPIPDVLLKEKNTFGKYFSEYEGKARAIMDVIKEKEKELAELKKEVAESVKKEIFEYYK